MAKSQSERLRSKKQQLVERTAAVLHVSQETTEHLLAVPRQQSIRINPLNSSPQTTLHELKDLGWKGQPIDWCLNGYTIDEGLLAIRDSDLVRNGSVYIQNAASWLPVLALDPQPGDEILDICAAPGGKTSHIAALTDNLSHITANDNSRPRLAKMQANLARLGVENIEYTLFDASILAKKLNGSQFDKVLLDAPCSGEGMMQLSNDTDFNSWSVAHIKRLQQLQKRLILQAWQLLKPGGTLVYSTCTMAPEENEAVIDYLIRRNNGAHIESKMLNLENRVPAVREWNGRTFHSSMSGAMRLIPSKTVEAFFVCTLTKFDNSSEIV